MGGQLTGDGNDGQMTAVVGRADSSSVGDTCHIVGRGRHNGGWAGCETAMMEG